MRRRFFISALKYFAETIAMFKTVAMFKKENTVLCF